MQTPVREIEVELVGNEKDRVDGLKRWADWAARVMDELVVIPGTGIRVGLDPILGLLPVGGDAAASIASVMVLIQAGLAKVPKVTIFRMGLNILANTCVGAIPFAGDLFSVWFKSNVRNRELLQRHLGGGSNTRTDWIFVGAVVAVLLLASVMAFAVSLAILVKFIQWIA